MVVSLSTVVYRKSQAVIVTCKQESRMIILIGTEKIQISDDCVIYTENLIIIPSRVLSSEIRKDLVSKNPNLNTMLKLSEIINNRVSEQINTKKYYKCFYQFPQDAENLKELLKNVQRY